MSTAAAAAAAARFLLWPLWFGLVLVLVFVFALSSSPCDTRGCCRWNAYRNVLAFSFFFGSSSSDASCRVAECSDDRRRLVAHDTTRNDVPIAILSLLFCLSRASALKFDNGEKSATVACIVVVVVVVVKYPALELCEEEDKPAGRQAGRQKV